MIKVNKLLAKKGFTLIELLVVIAIIGILATIIVASFTSAQQRARDSRRKADLDAFKKALELAKGDSSGGRWYAACNPAAASCTTAAAGNTTPNLTTGTTPYIRALPLDPSTGLYTYRPTPAACTYTVATGIGTCSGHTVFACLENINDPQRDKDASGNPVADNAAGDLCPATGRISYTISNP